MEALQPFNDERVARAVAACPIPVVSGVGHETDFTIIDFVADLRAPTPSAAAAAAVPDIDQVRASLRDMVTRLNEVTSGRLAEFRERLADQRRVLERNSPLQQLAEKGQRLDDLVHRLTVATQHRQRLLRLRLEAARTHLEALNPGSILGRGYAIVCDENTGSVLKSPKDTQVGRDLAVYLAGGELGARVTWLMERGAQQQ